MADTPPEPATSPPPAPPATSAATPAPHEKPARELFQACRRPLLILGILFLAFSAARLALLLAYPNDFKGLTGGQVIGAFVHGLRFDASMICTFVGGPLLLLMLPLGWAQRRLWQALWGWMCFAWLVAFVLVLWIDVLYYPYVHRHIGRDVTLKDDLAEAVWLSALRQYVGHVVAFLLVAVGLFWLWRRLLRPPVAPVARRGLRIAILLIAGGLVYLGGRGSVSSKRVKIVHAFAGVPAAAGQLALNGPFTIQHSLDDSRALKADFYPPAEATRAVQEMLFAPDEKPADREFPLLRSRPPRGAPRPNVVLLMLESWDAYYCDVLRREQGLPSLGATPRFDALCGEGLLFTRFYANGQKSMDGMCALLCGFPTLPFTPYLGRGMEQSNLTYLGRLAREEGYATYFIQSSKRESFRNDQISRAAGFTTYLGGEDIPPSAPAAGRAVLGNAAWDHEMLAEANRRFSAAPHPFLGFVYTATTHAPFAWPEKKWETRPPDRHENRFLNSLAYADWALGEFFAGAKASGYFDRTIFVLTADHIGGLGGASADDRRTLHHVPCLILAPGLKPALERRIGSHLDVLPTIVDLAGWGAMHAALGRSLLSPPRPDQGAFCLEGDFVLRIEEGGAVLHNLKERTEAKTFAEGSDLDAVERRLLSTLQVAATLLRQNRVFPSGTR